MNESHVKCMKAAIDAWKKGETEKLQSEDFFTAKIDNDKFEATEVLGYSSFGVNMVLGVIKTDEGRRYISFAADIDVPDTEVEVCLDCKVTIGYVIEEPGFVEYLADQGVAQVGVRPDRTYTGTFSVSLEEGSAYSTISDASFSVKTLRTLSQA